MGMVVALVHLTVYQLLPAELILVAMGVPTEEPEPEAQVMMVAVAAEQ
jgi:hypothetical protein